MEEKICIVLEIGIGGRFRGHVAGAMVLAAANVVMGTAAWDMGLAKCGLARKVMSAMGFGGNMARNEDMASIVMSADKLRKKRGASLFLLHRNYHREAVVIPTCL